MNLRILRKNKKKSQEEIAKLLNITQRTYSGYELETSEPTIKTLCILADYYDVSLDQLIGREYKNDIGYLTEAQKNIVYVIKQLNEGNLNELLGTALKLLNEQ